jgi:hypothetical protein
VSDAVALILEGKGSHFDPEIVDAFVELVDRNEVTRLDERVRTPAHADGNARAAKPEGETGVPVVRTSVPEKASR